MMHFDLNVSTVVFPMRESRHSLAFDLSVMVGCFAVLGYFGWHAYYGPRSFTHGEFVQAEVRKYQAELDATQEQRNRLDARVALLRPQSIDPDMLDEMARKTLEFAAPGDLIVKK